MSTTEYSPAIYTGDPSRVFINAIAAKVEGRISDAQFDALLAATVNLAPVPVRHVNARPVFPVPTDEDGQPRNWRVLGITIHNPVVLGIALVLIAAVAITLMGVVVIGLMGAITWAKANAAMIGGVVILVIVLICAVLGMLARMNSARADAHAARTARYAYQHQREQRPVYVNADSDSKEMS